MDFSVVLGVWELGLERGDVPQKDMPIYLRAVIAGTLVLAGQIGQAKADLEQLKALLEARLKDGNDAGFAKLGLMVAVLGQAIDAAEARADA